jgi:hypothetical protein
VGVLDRRKRFKRRHPMEPLLIILVPGLLGGLVLALLIAGTRLKPPSTVVPHRLSPPSPAMINMANIRVEGIGGLGMVAAVVAVAVADPRIRLATILAVVLGVGLALVLIRLRRGTGALPSSGDGTDDRSILHLDRERRHTHLAAVRRTVERVRHGRAERFPVFGS